MSNKLELREGIKCEAKEPKLEMKEGEHMNGAKDIQHGLGQRARRDYSRVEGGDLQCGGGLLVEREAGRRGKEWGVNKRHVWVTCDA